MRIECPKCKCQLEILPEHYGQEIECPNMDCQGLFYVPKMSLGRTTACPFCGQHVRVK